jgi:transcriptional regulator with XRE-family HTH domain
MTKINLLRRKANLSQKKTAEICGVTIKTIRNWESGKTKTPISAIKLIGIFSGKLDFVDKTWENFYFDGECIISKNGNHLYPFEIDTLPWLYKLAKIQRFKICKIAENPKQKLKVNYKEDYINEPLSLTEKGERIEKIR